MTKFCFAQKRTPISPTSGKMDSEGIKLPCGRKIAPLMGECSCHLRGTNVRELQLKIMAKGQTAGPMTTIRVWQWVRKLALLHKGVSSHQILTVRLCGTHREELAHPEHPQ